MLQIAVLVALAALIRAADFCDQVKSVPNEVCVVTGFNCGGKDFIFDKLPKDALTYRVVFDHAEVDCQRQTFRLGLDTKGSKVTMLKIEMINSRIKAMNVSIDAGDPRIEGSAIILANSTINTSLTRSGGDGFNATERSIYFSGSCTAQRDRDRDSSTEFNLTNLRSYGKAVLPKGSTLLDGDSLYSSQYFGSGGDASIGINSFGGGRVYLRSFLLKADSDTRVLANALNTKDPADVYLAGTGGVVMIAAGNIDLPETKDFLSPQSSLIQALGSYLFKNNTVGLLGSGGRVYIQIVDSDKSGVPVTDLPYSVAIGLEGSPCETRLCFGVAGTLFIKAGSSETALVYSSVSNSSEVVSNLCYTVLDAASLDDRERPLDLKLTNLASTLVISDKLTKDKETGHCRLTLGSLSFQNGAKAVLLFDCGVKDPQSLIPDAFPVDLKTDRLNVIVGSLIVRSPLIILGPLFTLQERSSVVIGGNNFYYPGAQTISLQVLTKVVNLGSDSSISSSAIPTHKTGYQSTLVVTPGESFNCTGLFEIKAQRVLFNFTNIGDVSLTRLNIIGSDSYCSSAPASGLSHNTERLLSSYFANSSFWRETSIADDQFRFNSSLIVLAQNLTVDKSSWSRFGFIAVGTRGWLNLTSSTVLSANAAGCPARDLSISEIGSKYLKICKVLGGSNVGRGTLGSQKNFDNCKYVMSVPRNKGGLYLPASGGGGQKNHQMEMDQSGYGGGIIALYNPVMYLSGNLTADGGDKSEQDYTMIAGGAGGTITLRGSSFSIMGNMTAKGGANDLEVVWNKTSLAVVEEARYF